MRHLRARQAVSLVCHRIFRSRKLRTVKPCRVELKKLLHTPGFPEWQPAAALRMIETREFDFLNVRQERSNRILWSATGFERLWLYHLNYFDFLNVDFSVRRRRALLPEALELALDWCNQNATGAEVGWDSYPLSMRIVNWLKFLVRNAPSCASASDRQAISTLLGSLRDQTLALEGRLEMDIMANHLLKNGKALMFAGALLESPESARWWSRGERLLAKELREQILSDGGHFERSPMYHAQVLEDLLDLQALAAA
ncbi:MAG: heparinase II/III family protein, partial [Terriglobia bacterium]